MLNAPEAEACSVEDVSDAELLHQVEDGDDGVTLSILLQVTRMAIVLDSEGYERKEIAEQLHLSADAVTKKIQRGMLYLRSVFSVVA